MIKIEKQHHTHANSFQKQPNPEQKNGIKTCFPIHPPYPEAKEIKNPKGNAYMEKMEKEENQKLSSFSPEQEESNGDSRLSIELGLRQAKSNKKLNYGVYLQE